MILNNAENKMNPAGISVIVCTYNAQDRIEPTLRCLIAQDLRAVDVPWEVILVDNNSSDQTVEIAMKTWGGFKVPLVFRHEKRQGLSHARASGFAACRYEYVLMCDDDNHLAPDYLNCLFKLFESKPECMMIGGQGCAISDMPLPLWFQDHALAYAAAPQRATSGYVDHLYGAGSAIRKSSYDLLHQLGFRPFLSGRSGKGLSSGEDYELCKAIRLLGGRLWYDADLKFNHFIPSGRLNWNYLVRMARGNASTRIVYHQYDQYLHEDSPFSPSRLLLLNVGLLFKYSLRRVGAVEGDQIILDYAGWLIKVETLIRYLFFGSYRVENMKEFIFNAERYRHRCEAN